MGRGRRFGMIATKMMAVPLEKTASHIFLVFFIVSQRGIKKFQEIFFIKQR